MAVPDVAWRLAPAKINLFLHVGALDRRGYHPLRSLVGFADIGDRVALSDAPGLHLEGPFSEGLDAGEDNLVMKALRRFEIHADVGVRHGVRLDKRLPVASGLGGGSADAGAVLHLLREAYAPDMEDEALNAIAAGIGADGPMCLWSRSVLAEGYGERLSDVALTSLPCVLVNPLVSCSTSLVYKAFDALEPPNQVNVKRMSYSGLDAQALTAHLAMARNDLQLAAIGIQPVIAEVLDELASLPETRLARMSGSGATCFALCDSDDDAIALSCRMQAFRPHAWVRACRIG